MAESATVERAALIALQLRDVAKLGSLLKSRPELIRHTFKNRGGRTLLHLATQDGCTPYLNKLLDTQGCELYECSLVCYMCVHVCFLCLC